MPDALARQLVAALTETLDRLRRARPHEADDAVQEAFLALNRLWRRGVAAAALERQAGVIARRMAKLHLRREDRGFRDGRRRAGGARLDQFARQQADGTTAADARADVAALLARLPGDVRVVVRRVWMDGRGQQVVAVELGASRAKVQRQLAAARPLLRAALGG